MAKVCCFAKGSFFELNQFRRLWELNFGLNDGHWRPIWAKNGPPRFGIREDAPLRRTSLTTGSQLACREWQQPVPLYVPNVRLGLSGYGQLIGDTKRRRRVAKNWRPCANAVAIAPSALLETPRGSEGGDRILVCFRVGVGQNPGPQRNSGMTLILLGSNEPCDDTACPIYYCRWRPQTAQCIRKLPPAKGAGRQPKENSDPPENGDHVDRTVECILGRLPARTTADRAILDCLPTVPRSSRPM